MLNVGRDGTSVGARGRNSARGGSGGSSPSSRGGSGGGGSGGSRVLGATLVKDARCAVGLASLATDVGKVALGEGRLADELRIEDIASAHTSSRGAQEEES